MHHATNPVFASPNKLKLGCFAPNLLSIHSLAPDVWKPGTADCIALARLVDDLGLECVVNISRWKGYLPDRFEHPGNAIWDGFTLAAAMAVATKYTGIMTTTNAPMVHPALAAKLTATIDHLSGGRFTLNIVGGWVRPEFEVFGIELLDHNERYAYLQEWLDVLQKLWTATSEFDHEGQYFRLKGALSRPQPIQQPSIPIMNAGLSEVGNRFAARNADVAFIHLGEDRSSWAKDVANLRAFAREAGREVAVWGVVFPYLRDSDEEAKAYHHYVTDEMIDRESVNGLIAIQTANAPQSPERYEKVRMTATNGGGLPVVGSPRTVAATLAEISAAGFDGTLLRFVDQIDGFRRFGRQVLPLLEEAGLRMPFSKARLNR